MIWLTLFGVCFLAATLVPFYSEFMVVGMVLGGHDTLAVLTVATVCDPVHEDPLRRHTEPPLRATQRLP